MSYRYLNYLRYILNQEGLSAFNEEIDLKLKQHYFYDRVVKIEPVTNIAMYDIEVEDYNSFVANGFICHNSQGLTFDKVFADFNRIFAAGQAYVALSRVTSLDGLYLKGFSPNKVFADETVKKFYHEVVK